MTDMTPQELTALKLKFYDALVCDPKLSAMDLRIAWLLLSRYLNAASLVAWPSAETLASDLGSSLRGVRKSIQRLTAPGGWFKHEHGGGRQHSNVYSANFERVNAGSPFRAETVNARSPFNGARGARGAIHAPLDGSRGAIHAPLDNETVNARSLKGELPSQERVNASSPYFLLSKPFEEPIEETSQGARARGSETVVARHDTQKPTNLARQGNRGGGNSRDQGHFMLPFQGDNQQPKTRRSEPDWNGWSAWLQSDQGMTKEGAWAWLTTTITRIETERGVNSTEAGAILDRELKQRRKAVA